MAYLGGKEWEVRDEVDSMVQSTSSQGEAENIDLDIEHCAGSKKTVSCNECGTSLLFSSLGKHRRRFHPKQLRPSEKVLPAVPLKKRSKHREAKWEVLPRPRSEDVFPHEEVGKVKCDECGKSFIRKWNLRVHKKIIHQGERLPCKVADCEKTFRGYNARENHMRMVHGSPMLRCKFEGCASEFYSNCGLNSHHLAHQK